jgi:hypothetical protein
MKTPKLSYSMVKIPPESMKKVIYPLNPSPEP